MHVGPYIGALRRQEKSLGDGLLKFAKHHVREPGIAPIATLLAGWSHQHVTLLGPAADRYHARLPLDVKLLASALFAGPRSGPLGLLNDFQELIMLAGEVQLGWALVGQAARALRDLELIALAKTLPKETERQKEWLETRIKELAPQTLVVG